MAGTRARPPGGSASSGGNGPELTRQEAAEYIASLLEGLRSVASSGQMPFLTYLINVALDLCMNSKLKMI